MLKNYVKAAYICGMGSSLLLFSCVNDDYDLSEDVDMTIQVNGELSLPYSSTEEMLVEDLFEIEEDGIVQADAETGVYMLRKRADEKADVSIDIDNVEVNNPDLEDFHMTFQMPSREELLEDAGYSAEQRAMIMANPSLLETMPGANDVKSSRAVPLMEEFHMLEYDFELPEEVMAIRRINFSTPMKPDFELSTNLLRGKLVLTEVYAHFPDELDHDNYHEGGYWSDDIEHNRYTLPSTIKLVKDGAPHKSSLEFVGANVEWEKFDANGNPSSALSISKDVRMAGNVQIEATPMEFWEMADQVYELTAVIKMKKIEIGSVEAIVDPVIEPESSVVELGDLPDFLTEEGVKVYLQNPQFFLDVETNIPLEVDVWGQISTDQGISVDISREGSSEIQLGGKSLNNYCIYDGQKPDWGINYTYYAAPGLRSLLEKVPEELSLDFNARVNQTWYTLQLGETYTASIDYRVDCPLAFGAGTEIVYTDTLDEWNEDIEDYEVKELTITGKLYNSTPLEKISLKVIPLGLDGQELRGIEVTSAENLKDGDDLALSLKCTQEGAMKNLDGVVLRIEGSVVSEASSPLNKHDYIQVKDIKVKVTGGIIADLN
ncbi:MAG: hypothetical protein IJ467_06230 [Bacteroidaceae bacterium]|nr:hypothetical protein [Bacteroidaceae bacterium]